MGLFDNIKRQAENLLRSEVNQASHSVASAAGNAIRNSAKTKTVTLSSLPQSADEMRAMPEFTLSDPFTVLALAVCAFDRYATDREASKEMINFLKGPQPLSIRDIQFINDRFMDGKGYVTRSYFARTGPDNDYTVSPPYTVTIVEQSNSRENDGYIRLYLKSSGADSERPVTLRYKQSTNEWFLWDFEAMLSGIRPPKSTDKWA